MRWSWQQSGMGVFALEWLCCGACNGCVVLAVTVLCSCTNVSCCLSRFCGVGWLDAAPSPVSPSLSPFCVTCVRKRWSFTQAPRYSDSQQHMHKRVSQKTRKETHMRAHKPILPDVCVRARACVLARMC